MKTAITALEDMRTLLARPASWRHSMIMKGDKRRSRCIGEMLVKVVADLSLEEHHRAIEAIYLGCGLDARIQYIHKWNDAPGRTHAEVLAAIDAGLKLLREGAIA